MDFRAFKLVNGLAGHGLDGLFRLLATDLAAVIMALVALVFLVRWSRRRQERRAGALLGTVSAALALLAVQPLSHAVARVRPYAAHPGHAHLLIARSADFSFPSDHAVGAFALAFGIWLYDRALGRWLLILAAILAFSRVVAGTHYPGDVLAGAAIGVAVPAALFALPASRRLLERAAERAGELWDRVPPRAAAAGSSGASRP
ncbi:MAG: undecaprenyl-diphosphatase [Solirubrobacteraceae bacterium]|jgi:membrane-associated phospholipid phosphatase|nr:undecaprenyl-diphosphatase [Solirubrobacteraceae bacterium]